MKIRTLLVDDEDRAVSRLRQLCADHPDIAVIGEARTGPEALEKLQTFAPKLLFLDINLGAMSGLDVLSCLDPDDRPFVIFVTASDTHAATAFDLAAVDYLLKPCTPERFAQAVGKIRQCVALGLAAPGAEQLLAGWRKTPATAGTADAAERRDGLFVEDGGRFVFLDTGSIDFVEAARNYVVIHAGKTTYCHRTSMSALEDVLNPAHFVRVHKSIIVNITRVESVQSDFKGAFVFRLASGAQCHSGPSYSPRIRNLLRPPPARSRRRD